VAAASPAGPPPAAGSSAAAAPLSAASATGTTAAPVDVRVTERDYAISAPAGSVHAGPVNLTVTNAGPSPHELVIFKTALAAHQMPVANGSIDASSAALTRVFDTGSNIDPGATKTFHTNLGAGKYVIVCDRPAHYLAGMHAALEVS
jgi:uncharacterized cupredoxin-like copper-binding protein